VTVRSNSTTKSRARRQAHKDDLRRAFMDAARELFLTEGYEQVTLRRIAERTAYSHAAIYSHFKDKQEIVTALSEEGFLLMLGFLRTVQKDDPISAIQETARVYWQFAITHPNYYRIMFLLESLPVRSMMEKDDTNGDRAYQHILELVQRAQACGRLEPSENPHVVAHIFWSRLHGLASLKLSERLGPKLPEGTTVAQVVNRSTELILAGLVRPAP
jgi:AcrR family transcriptional regulator